MEEEDLHLFMLCAAPNLAAFQPLPRGFRFRACRRDELDVWMAMPFDSEEDAAAYRGFMEAFFRRVYGAREALFFERCTFACDEDDRPVSTAFTWEIRQGITTFHWLKTLRPYEGMGIGRAMVAHAMAAVPASAYPVLLHTHPTSHRAVKLYSDFGFELLSDPVIGSRRNDLERCLPDLRRVMPAEAFERLVVRSAPPEVLARLADETEPEF